MPTQRHPNQPSNNPRRGRYAAPVNRHAAAPAGGAEPLASETAAQASLADDAAAPVDPAVDADAAEETFEFAGEPLPIGAVAGNPRDRVVVSAKDEGAEPCQGGSVVVQPGLTGSTPVIGATTTRARVIPRQDGDEPLRHATPTPHLQGAHEGAVVAPSVRRASGRMARPSKAAAIVAALVVVAVGVGAYLFLNPPFISVTVNGQTIQVPGGTTIDDLIEDGTVSPAPGNLLAIDGNLLQEGGGARFTAIVNGQPEDDGAAKLPKDAAVSISDGGDLTEEYAEEEVVAPSQIEFEGVGAIHAYEGTGAPGKALRRTGSVSGVVVDEVTEPPSDEVIKKYNADTAGDKVVALTFDDGPWPDSTNAILDILDENGAKATFFTIGQQISGTNAEAVKRAFDAGHQISSHSYDHASGSGNGVDLGHMTPEERVDEVTKGYEAIKAVTGVEPSHAFRTPGGNFSAETAQILQPYVDAEIGWNIDTEDWRRPGAAAIADRIKQAKPGSIILMHDGGGDRSQTVEALRIALPYLREQGYRFITVDELLAYNDPADM